ncbi:MAG: ABC transporter ATP-binding protein [Rubrivivax sp.]
MTPAPPPPPTAALLLSGEGLALRVGERTLLRGLDLTVRPGELWCVLGPNGSGKTTLLHTLAGLRAPDAGTVRLDGTALPAWPADALARRRGLLPQSTHDAFGSTVLETVMLGRHPHLGRWAWEGEGDRARALEALRALEIDGLAARDVTTLSGGERQRVAIAALLAQDPALLLLDEPLSHLDLRHQVQLLQRLRARVDGDRSGDGARHGPNGTHDGPPRHAVLLSIHDLALARRYATHALLLAGDGAVPPQGPVAQAMDAEALGRLLGHPLTVGTVGGQVVYVAG